MKIILEDKDRIIFKQTSKLINKECKTYSANYTCSVMEIESGNNGNLVLDNHSAIDLFSRIYNGVDSQVIYDIVSYVNVLLGFKCKEGEQVGNINVKSTKDGIVFEINGELFTPEKLMKDALLFNERSTPVLGK